ncbi:nucleoside-diphosphate sugar epimerase/dehydratase [Paludicola sp. MB14-C6]|uniref:polysaccharide biosynthesis protein n=1 Tax=Paludihabitans sp. MB14-C6 TaxID=3070656 RepID=UPI0027DB247C|nr:nucleoside-diphosphate sugar epimerase/dehydratase [Paludicola sp. MB14-C6]WMJ22585.1 nucleoside-diphosphate sugar epimerase/dehydratase [Paludicola sp. MB14-C6]
MISLKRNKKINLLVLVCWDILSVYLAIILGFKFRFGFVGAIPKRYDEDMIFYVLIMILVAIMSNTLLRCYSAVWRYLSYKDLIRQLLSSLLSAVFVILIDNFIGLEMPFELFVMIPSLMFLFMLIGRSSPRAYVVIKSFYQKRLKSAAQVKTLIYGAGEAGNYLMTKLAQKQNNNTIPVGFIDDDKALWGLKIGQVPVLGGEDILEFVIKDLNVKELIIAIPSADVDFIKQIYMRCQKCGVIVKRYGTLADVTVEDFRQAPIKQINFEELLRRDSVKLNMDIVNKFIKGKVVLVTGGVGSIGSEICRQVLKFGAKKLLVFDINENGLFYMKNELDEAGYQGRFEVLVGSIRDRNRLREVFFEYEPSVVFHAAAHKHVPMMEGNPKEAIKNNVLGTINVANEAIFHDVEKFILISTDKAVNPTNIMGASKRIAEIAIQIMNSAGNTDFAAVRFGNVLGSNGSVVPFFNKQIESGGPVTVTHPEMKRYFMTIPEAVQLVLEAGAMATGGEIFVLEMGEPVLIYDLACDLIRLHGYEPNKDIEIKFTGLRPGEKLFEEISLADEDTTKTVNNKIYICKPTEHNPQEFSRNIKRLENVVKQPDIDKMFAIIKEMVVTFNHNNPNGNSGGQDA